MKFAHVPFRLQLSLLAAVALLSVAPAANGQEATETKVVRQQQPATPDVKPPAPAVDATKPFDPAPVNVQGAPQGALPFKSPTIDATSRLLPADRFARPYYDVVDGSIWVRGATYKAEFSTSGATYIPFFGSAAPQNYPVSMSVLDARVGGQLLPMLAVPAQRAGDVVEYAHGSFVERYQISTHSIEQLFVFDSLPAAGDLVVRIGFQSDLQPQMTADGLRFSNDLGYVNYGNATLVDANGQRTAIPGEWIDGGLELRVAASDLATAAFPITVDPVVSTFTIDTAVVDQFSADAAFTATSARYCVVYEEAFSATDHDVRGETLNSTGGQVLAGYFDFTTDYWAHPRVASNAIANNFLCVAARGSPTGGAREIWGRIGSATLVFGAQFQISSTGGGDKLVPDVGGDPVTTPPTHFLVVWERVFSTTDRDIHARLVDANSTLPGSVILIDNSGATIDRFPAISKSDGDAPFGTQNWHIVWTRDFSATDRDIRGAAVLWDGSITNASYSIDFSGLDDTNPRVSSQLNGSGAATRNALVVYERGTGTANDIIGTVVNNGVVIDYATNISALGTFQGQNQIEPAADSDGTRFAVVYSELFMTSTTDYDIWVDALNFTGGNLVACELHENLAFSGSAERDAAITSTFSGNGAAVRFLSAWDDRFSATDRDIEGGLYDATCTPIIIPPVPYCFGNGTGTACPCGNSGAAGNGCAHSLNPAGAHLGSSGNADISNDTLSLNGSGMPNAAALYFQGTAQIAGGSGAVFGDGLRCAGGTVVRLGTKTNVGGASSYPTGADPDIHIKGNCVAGDIRFYQCWFRNAAAFCTPSTFNLTNGLRVTWTP